jgi:hypothetical protein
MRQSLAGQRGVSFGAVMIVLVLVIFFVNLLVTMGPSYLTFWQVRSAMDALREKPDVIAGGPHAILNSLRSQLSINNVRSVKSDAFDFEKTKDGWQLITSYDVQKHIAFNVDVVMHFTYDVELEKP